MSRGRGAVQRRLLASLNAEERPFETFELAACAFDVQPDNQGDIFVTDAELVSTRRALRKLVREGAIYDYGRHYPDGRQRWASERLGLRDLIRHMQHENLLMTDLAILRARAKEMAPLLNRARELGIKIY
jgi:hypothetical protein